MAHSILTKDLKMRRVAARWTPHPPTIAQKQNRVHTVRPIRLRHDE